MSPVANTVEDVQAFVRRGEHAQDAVSRAIADAGRGPDDPISIPPVAAAAPDDPWGKAMGALTLAIANADRALRRQPILSSALDLHRSQAARYHASGVCALLEHQPGAQLVALNEAGQTLREFAEQLLHQPDAAIMADPELMTDACVAMVRKILGAYRERLVMQLTELRAGAAVEASERV